MLTAGVDPAAGTKGPALLAHLLGRAPWLAPNEADEHLTVSSDDAFDPVIAALATRAHALGLTHVTPPECRARAQREGWTALPSGPPEEPSP